YRHCGGRRSDSGVQANRGIAGAANRVHQKVGDQVQRGERVGMIKFGSRVDVLLDASARVQVKVGDHVKGGASVLPYLAPEPQQLASVGAAQTRQGAR